jgi:amino acid transporter
VLNAAVGVSAGVAALTSAFPALYGGRVWLCLVVLALITGVNLIGVAEAARVFIVPTILFILAIAIVIGSGLFRSHPVVPPVGHLPSVAESVGILLLLKAFASGCSALTGVEAIANAVPEFKRPRAHRAQHTEMMLGIILGLMLIGIAVLIKKFHITPSATTTTLAQLAAAGVGHNVLFYGIQLITTVLLALAANTSFGGLPVLASLLAKDNYLPHMFALQAERQVYRYGISVLAVAAAVLLVVARGNTQALIPVFAIGVFVGFSLSQAGMVRHWHEQHGPGWEGRAVINGLGAVLTTAALGIELVSKFTEGAWLVVIVIPLLVLFFERIHRAYRRIGAQLGIGQPLDPPQQIPSLVVVPVQGLSRLTREGISAALSLGDKVVAVEVCYDNPDATDDQHQHASFSAKWHAWDPDVPLVILHSAKRQLGPPVVDYLRAKEMEDPHRRIVALIPEVQPEHWWLWFLHNQRGAVLNRAIMNGTDNVVICRLRFRLAHLAPDEESGTVPAERA